MNKAFSIICIVLCCVVSRGYAADAAIPEYGPVKRGDTLYRIALKHRPPGVTVAQMMMSIFEANPRAFHKFNINRLKVGSILKIPGLQEIDSLERERAHKEATAQIDTYEREERERKVASGEVEPLSLAPRDPDLVTGVSSPDPTQIEEIKQVLAVEELAAQGKLPEPKPAKRKKRKRSEGPAIRYSYEIAYIDDDNVRLAQNDDDIREDSILSATLKAKGGKTLDSFTIWNYGANVTANKHDTFDELDNIDFEVNTRYRFALSSGFTSPIYSLGARLGGLEYESEMRDSTVLNLSADLNKWLTNTINMTTGLGFTERDSVSEVFDLSEARIFVNFDTNLTKTDLIYTTFTFIDGDTVSSATPTLDIINVADAIEPDDAFGGIDANQFAYRIDAETWVITLGYNRILTRDISIDLSARYIDSEAKDDSSIGYDRTILRASLLGRF